MRVVKLFLVIVLVIFLGLIAWMNLTPGYFQYSSCGCTVEYLTDQKSSTCALSGVCEPAAVRRFIDPILLLFAKLDFNKGNGSGGLNEPQPIPAPKDKFGAEGSFCGGLSNTSLENQCPPGYTCQLVNNYPDAPGKCVSSSKQPSPAYTCPKTEWVDCMPGPGPVKPECQKEYLSWATNNCPNFKGATY